MIGEDEIRKGDGPMMLWHYVGLTRVAPFKVSKRKMYLAGAQMDDASRQVMFTNGTAVLITSMAINKMMGRPLEYGQDDGEDDIP